MGHNGATQCSGAPKRSRLESQLPCQRRIGFEASCDTVNRRFPPMTLPFSAFFGDAVLFLDGPTPGASGVSRRHLLTQKWGSASGFSEKCAEYKRHTKAGSQRPRVGDRSQEPIRGSFRERLRCLLHLSSERDCMSWQSNPS